MSLKQSISQDALKFKEIVYPFVKTSSRQQTPELSRSTEKSERAFLRTTSTIPDDDYGIYSSKVKQERKKYK